MNHCFDDVERFMARLQQVAEAQRAVSQRTKKRSKKSKNKEEPSGESCTTFAWTKKPEHNIKKIFLEDPSGVKRHLR